MSAVCELTAAEIVCSIGGSEYRLSPLTVADVGRLEREVATFARTWGKTATNRPATDPRSGERGDAEVTLDQLADWLETIDGQSHALWLCLRRHHGDVTRGQAAELLQTATAEGSDLRHRWSELWGGPPKNSSGQT